MSTSIKIENPEHWHTVRAQHVGGSEIASLFYEWKLADGTIIFLHMFETPPAHAQLLGCVSRHTTGYRLYHVKAGLLPADNLDDNERVQAGVFMEPAIAEWAKAKWNWNIRNVKRYIQIESGLGCSRDYEAVEAGFPTVQIKSVDGLIFRDQWIVDGEDIVGPPLDIVLQVQQEIAATDADHGWIVACVSGNRLLRGRIARHEPTIERIKAAARRFWIGVEAGEKPNGFEDYGTISALYASGVKDKMIDLTSDNEAPELCAAYLKAKAALDNQETLVDTIKAKITAKLGEATKAVTQGYTMGWPAVHREEKMIPAKMQAALDYRQGLRITPKG